MLSAIYFKKHIEILSDKSSEVAVISILYLTIRRKMKRKACDNDEGCDSLKSKRRKIRNLVDSVYTSTPNLQRNEGKLLKLSKKNPERNYEVRDSCINSEGKTVRKGRDHTEHTVQCDDPVVYKKRKETEVTYDVRKSTKSYLSHDSKHSRNNNVDNGLRNEYLCKSKFNDSLCDEEATNSVKKKNSRTISEINSNLISSENCDVNRRKSSSKKNKVKLDETAVDVSSELSISCSEDPMHSKSFVQYSYNDKGIKKLSKKKKKNSYETPVDVCSDNTRVIDEMHSKKKKLKNALYNTDGREVLLSNKKTKKRSICSGNICSELSDDNFCSEEEMRSQNVIDVCNDEERKQTSKKKKKKKKHTMDLCSDDSSINSCSEFEVLSQMSRDEGHNNEHRKESASRKKKHSKFSDNIDSNSTDTTSCVGIKLDKKRRKTKTYLYPKGVSTNLSADNYVEEDKSYSGTSIERVHSPDRKKVFRETKKREHHKETSIDVTSNLPHSDAGNSSSAVHESPSCLEKDSTENIKEMPDEEDLFEFPSSDESFHLCIDSDSDASFINENLKSKNNVQKRQPEFTSVDNDDYEQLLKDALLNKFCFTDDVIRKLKNLNINLHHNAYPLHCVDAQPCKTPKKSDKEIYSKFRVRYGQFTENEDKILLKNWKMFCEEYKFKDPEPFTNFLHNHVSMEKRRDFLQYLGKDLPDRPLYLIFNHFVYLMKHQNKGQFSKEEDEIILRTIKRKLPNPYSVLSKMLKRNRQSIYKRYKMMESTSSKDNGKTTSPEKRAKWSISLAKLVVKSLAKVMKLSSIEELRNIKIPVRIWQKVEKLSHVRFDKLMQFWKYKLHIQLFAESPINKSEIFQKIIRWLHSRNFSSVKDISWEDSIHLVPGSTAWFMWAMFRRLRRKMNANQFTKFEDFIKFLYKHRKEIKVKNNIPRYRVGEDFSLRETR